MFYKIGGVQGDKDISFQVFRSDICQQYVEKHKTLTLSVELAPTSQLHSTDLLYTYDDNQCERNWPPETALLLH